MSRLKLTTRHLIRKQVKHIAVTDPTYNWEKMSGNKSILYIETGYLETGIC